MSLKESTQEELIERLSGGESLVSVCRDDEMPSVRSVQTWANDDKEYSAQITRAREAGYLHRAEAAVEAAKNAVDASMGRLAFDAERWYIGKLSNAFADKIKHVGGDAGDAPIRSEVVKLERTIIDPQHRHTA